MRIQLGKRPKHGIVVGAVVALAVVGAGITASSQASAGVAAAKKAKAGGWVIGVSNPVIGNGWRFEWENEIKTFAALPQNKRYIKAVKIVNSPNNDPTQQAAAIRNLISEGVNALIIDAATPAGLNTVIAQAHAAGIKVVCGDNVCTSPYAETVALDNFQFGKLQAQWLVKALHGQGNIVMIRGVVGASADVDRYDGAMSVFKKAKGIKILDTVAGDWTESIAQKAMAQLLSTYSNIDGVWGEGGDGIGVVNAFLAAHRKFVPITGETTNGYRKDLAKYAGRGLTGISVGGGMANGVWAMRQALDELKGVHTVPSHILLPDTAVASDKTHPLKAGIDYFPGVTDIFWLGYNNTLPKGIAFNPHELLKGEYKPALHKKPAPRLSNVSFWKHPKAAAAPH